jgi:hypothetical protein
MEKINKGTVVVFTSGEYSDFSINGVFVAIQDITKEHYAEAATEELKKGMYRQDEYTVLANLVKMGLLVDVESVQVYLGAYGSVQSELSFY